MADTIKSGQSKNGCLILGSRESGSFSIHEVGYLMSPNLALKSWMFPGELQVFSLCWDPEEVGSNISEGMPQRDGFTREREQAGKKRFPFSSFYLDCRWKTLPTLRVSLPQVI